ncbi:MAG: DUF4870 domain-containing protein, partial [Minisyncoccia bacterium]
MAKKEDVENKNLETKETSIGLKENEAALLAYFLTWLSGIIIYLVEKKSNFVRFHGLQSFVTFFGLTILQIFFTIIPFIGETISAIILLFELLLWVVCMIKAYQKEKFKLPVV